MRTSCIRAGVLVVVAVCVAQPSTKAPELGTEYGKALAALERLDALPGRGCHEVRRRRDMWLPMLQQNIDGDSRKPPLLSLASFTCLSYLGFDVPVDFLHRYMNRSGYGLRGDAMVVAGITRNPVYLPDLIAGLGTSEAAGCAAQALGYLGRPEAAPALLELLGKTPDRQVSIWCVFALGRLGEPGSRQAVAAYLQAATGDEAVAAAARRALHKIDAANAPNRAEVLLDWVRYRQPVPVQEGDSMWALEMIGRLKCDSVSASLRTMLDSRLEALRLANPGVPVSIADDDTAFELVRTLHKLGTPLPPDELKVLTDEHLIAEDGAARW